MQQNPPTKLAWLTPEFPAWPDPDPMLPAKVLQPGRQAPPPDSVAVRQVAVPQTAPPYDDELIASPPVVDSDDFAGNVAISAVPAPGTPVPAGGRTPAQHPPDERSSGASAPDHGGPRRVDPAGGWPSQFAQVLAETLAGSRPAQQLTPWTTEQARRRIRQLGPMLATDQRPRVRRIMASSPAEGVLEMTAVIRFGSRVRVLAVRLERGPNRSYRAGDARWCCTAIESA